MSTRILLITGNFSPELTGIGKYNGEMIDWLAAHNFECTVITTFPYYPQWRVQKPYDKKHFWFRKETTKAASNSKEIKVIRCPHYVPANPSGLKRMLSDFSFLFTSYLVTVFLILSKKIDYTIAVAPSFSFGLIAILYKTIRGGKFVYHIQDLQIDAARELKIIRSTLFLNMLFAVERYILKKADFVSTISERMMEKVKQKCNKEVIFFPNWVDTFLFHPVIKEQAKQDFNFKSSDKVVLYSGAIGFKQGLEAILHVAKSLEKVSNIRFLICGSGPYKVYLEALADRLNLKNLTFLPLQPYEKLNSFLNMADVHLVLQKNDAADLVMPSKLTTILAVGGIAIVTAKQETGLYDICNATNLGILIEPENEEILCTAIRNALEYKNEFLKKNARAYAVDNLSTDIVLSRFANKVFWARKEFDVHKMLKKEMEAAVIDISSSVGLKSINE